MHLLNLATLLPAFFARNAAGKSLAALRSPGVRQIICVADVSFLLCQSRILVPVTLRKPRLLDAELCHLDVGHAAWRRYAGTTHVEVLRCNVLVGSVCVISCRPRLAPELLLRDAIQRLWRLDRQGASHGRGSVPIPRLHLGESAVCHRFGGPGLF